MILKIVFSASNLTLNAGLILLLENAKANGIIDLINTGLVLKKSRNYSACEGIGGSGVAALPPHHSPHPSAAGLPEQLLFLRRFPYFLTLCDCPSSPLVWKKWCKIIVDVVFR